MGFVGIYKAVYDYAPQSDGELSLTEGNLLYIISKDGDDGWWRAKKKAVGDDDEEPEGLIPENYVEEAQPCSHARSLYEYTRQTDEELSFPDDAKLAIYDTSDDDWVLAGYEGEYGFAPANYINLDGAEAHAADGAGSAGSAGAAADHGVEADEPPPPALPTRRSVADDLPSPRLPPRGPPAEPSSPPASTNSGAAAALANVLVNRAAIAPPRETTPPPSLPNRPQYLSDASEDEGMRSPPLPSRPRPGVSFDDGELSPRLPQRNNTVSHGAGRAISGTSNSNSNSHNNGSGGGGGFTDFGNSAYAGGHGYEHEDEEYASNSLSPGGFHLYNISEMVSVMGKRKKMPTTLGINLKTGVILIAPERAQDGPSQEWTAEKMTHYSREGKHVFMELKRPSKSVDFHAGAKDTAEEIVSALGELAGAVRAEGLREVILAGTGHELKKAVALYDFVAQGDDEVTVATGDEVIVLDDASSTEWCQVRRVKNGKEGVIPSSYVEITGTISADIPPPMILGSASSPPTSPTRSKAPKALKETPAISASAATIGARTTVRQNRLDEEQLTRSAVRAAVRDESTRSEVGPGVRLPQRRSSLYALNSYSNVGGEQQQSRKNGNARKEKSKPDIGKVRTWTDRTKSFSVDAQFLGLKDGKINLHKLNGVKIAVPVAKMSIEDLEYVESVTGISLDEDKPLSSVKRKSQMQLEAAQKASGAGAKLGASVEKPEYDWFQFFLSCDVAVGLCERYAQAMVKDNMDESVLPDIDSANLRTLGLREGDIIKVMRVLDHKYNRGKRGTGDDGADGGGLFSGPGGTLRNNTRRGRPTPTTQATDTVDAKAFSQSNNSNGAANGNGTGSPSTADAAAASSSSKPPANGFDDDAWDVKPSRTPAPKAEPAAAPAAAAAAAAATAAPRAPEPAPQPAPAKPSPSLTGSMQELSLLTQPLPAEKLNPNPTPAITLPATATPAVSLPTLQQQQQLQQQQMPGATPALFAGLAQQQTGMQSLQAQQTAAAYARARPLVPQYTQGQGGLLPPPPPSRPLSAPQSAQPSVFGPPPLQPQMTGMMTGPMTGPLTGQVTGQVAPPGQSLNDINQARMQQQYAQQMQQMMAQQPQQQPQGMMPMMTGMTMQQQQPQPTGYGMPGQFMPQQQNQFVQPMQMQPTGFGMAPQQQQPQHTMSMPLNAMLPPALEPQRTAMPQQQQQQQQLPALQPQPTGHFTQGFGNHGMPQAPAPLMPQQTGPAPPVRFGVTDDKKKLMAQPTGRRANLSAATPDNPFGF